MKIKAVIFDLDGTITRPYIDFDKIRAEIGNISGPILEAMEQMTAEDRQKALAILERHEDDAAENSELNPGVYELCNWLRGKKMAIGLVTRNNRSCVARICEMHKLRFDSIVTRQDGPAKPDPFPVLYACEMMQVLPSEAVVVGDFLFDLISGRQAGAMSVLITTSENYRLYEHEADYVIHSLNELPGVIEKIESQAGSRQC